MDKNRFVSANGMRVNTYPQVTIRVTLIGETLMNNGIQAKYEGMRAETRKNFFWMNDYT